MTIKILGGAVILGIVGGTTSIFLEQSFAPDFSTVFAESAGRSPSSQAAHISPRRRNAADLDSEQPQKIQPYKNSLATSTAETETWSFRDCNEARASDDTPMYIGQPGYGPHMNGNNDGVACEVYPDQQ